MMQVEHVAKPVSEADMAGRMDLRDWQMVTIDGEDAKDLDDAVSLTMDHENYILGVHIADVSNYVQEHSALDTEALKRGTSVYLVWMGDSDAAACPVKRNLFPQPGEREAGTQLHHDGQS